MAAKLGYDVSVRRAIPASVAVFGLLAFPSLFASRSQAQIYGPPASVTSPGFGGHAINGVPASVTSPGFGGNYINGTRPSVTSVGPFGYAPGDAYNSFRHHHHHFDGNYNNYNNYNNNAPVWYAVPVPYGVDMGYTDSGEEGNGQDNADAEDGSDPNYQGGPTVFDRRGSGASSYIPVPRDAAMPRSPQPALEAQAAPTPPAPPAPPEPLDPTTLVFKDGHKMEVDNYAIIGQTLYDMTPGHKRRIPISSLDLAATQRENDDRGVNFQLPLSSQVN
jgi:hypothetical protein